MRSAKGFGKNYFTFSTILAYSVENKIKFSMIRIDDLLKNINIKKSNELDENDPPLEILTSICNSKIIIGSYCNCLYKLKTILSLKINHFIPRCPYYTTYFAFRRTGVHPPIYI